jgi:hypothetical protein
VCAWNRWLRRRHPEIAGACEAAERACAAAYPREQVHAAVVRAVEAGRVVVAVLAHEPGLIWRGRPPYHLFAVRLDSAACEELPDEPPYCFFAVK